MCFKQVVEDGYEFFAKRQLVTLFSAPNYCGEFDNAGAMMSVDETLMCSFQVSVVLGMGMPYLFQLEWSIAVLMSTFSHNIHLERHTLHYVYTVLHSLLFSHLSTGAQDELL